MLRILQLLGQYNIVKFRIWVCTYKCCNSIFNHREQQHVDHQHLSFSDIWFRFLHFCVSDNPINLINLIFAVQTFLDIKAALSFNTQENNDIIGLQWNTKDIKCCNEFSHYGHCFNNISIVLLKCILSEPFTRICSSDLLTAFNSSMQQHILYVIVCNRIH